MEQSKESTHDLVLDCCGGVSVHVVSSELIEASRSEAFRDIIGRARAEGTGKLGVPEDNPDGWKLCWSLINKAADQPNVTKANFIAALQLAHKYQLDGVLFQCQNIFICDLLYKPGYVIYPKHVPNYRIKCMDETGFEGGLRFLGLLSDVGLTTAYSVAFNQIVGDHPRGLAGYLKERLAAQGKLSDCPKLSMDLTSWLAQTVASLSY